MGAPTHHPPQQCHKGGSIEVDPCEGQHVQLQQLIQSGGLRGCDLGGDSMMFYNANIIYAWTLEQLYLAGHQLDMMDCSGRDTGTVVRCLCVPLTMFLNEHAQQETATYSITYLFGGVSNPFPYPN